MRMLKHIEIIVYAITKEEISFKNKPVTLKNE